MINSTLIHLDRIIKRASRQVSALFRIFPFMDLTERRALINSCFTSKFGYISPTWIGYSGTVNNKINKLHGRCLWIVSNEKKSSSKELLETDKSVPSGNKNLNGAKYSRIHWIKVFKGCLPQILLGPFFKTLSYYISPYRETIISIKE